MVNPAPVRVARKSTMSSPLVQAANKIVTSPTFAKARSIDFDKKNEYEKFIKFIESSNQELLRIKLPRKDEVAKEGGGDGKGGKGSGILGNLISGLSGIIAQRLMRRFKPLRNLRRFLIPRRFRARLRKLRMDILRPFRNFKKFILELPGKIKAKLKKYADDAVRILKKYTDDAVVAIKNLKNAKWIKTLISQSNKAKAFVDDGLKIGKEFITNSKVIKSAQKITQKAGPKLTSMGLGELTVVGGIVADVSAGIYRLSKGDKTGAALSFISAIPVIGLPVAAVDIMRDMNLFDDPDTFLGKTFGFLRTNKDNPNYVDERTDEEKQTDADLDEYLREKYINDIKEQLENLKGVGGKDAQRKRMGLTTKLRDFEKKDLSSTQLRTVTKDLVDFKLFGEDSASHDEIQKFLDNTGSSEITSDDSSSVTTIINNSQSFLLPFNTGGESTFTGGSAPNFNITTNVIDFDYSKMNSSFTDELLFLKLDK